MTMRGAVDAVREVSLEIKDGEFFAILGPSGCGKSTLLNLAAGLERPTVGEIRFDDRVVASPERRIFLPPRNRNVAMVFQSYALYPHLNVFDNIAFP
jgi:multiple sugar transport system ATP-binding protein